MRKAFLRTAVPTTLALICSLVLSSCAEKALSRPKAEELISKRVVLHVPISSKKPELAPLLGKQLTSDKVVVTGLIQKSATEAIADYYVETTWDKEIGKQYVDAEAKLQERLSTLKPIKKEEQYNPSFFYWLKTHKHTVSVYTFEDPSDQQTFVSEHVPDIKVSKEYRSIGQAIEYLSGRLKLNKERKNYKALFIRYDDGWRLQTPTTG